MKVVLIILGVLAVVYGGMIVAQAESAVHEIEYLICFLIGAVLVGSAGVVDAVESAAKPPPKPKEVTG